MKQILILLSLMLIMVQVSEAYENDSWRGLDTVYSGIGKSNGQDTQSYGAFNMATYKGDLLWLAQCEPSFNFGLLEFEKFKLGLDGIGQPDGAKPIISITVNGIEAAKLIEPMRVLMDQLPAWIYIGAGLSGEWLDDDLEISGKLIGAIKLQVG